MLSEHWAKYLFHPGLVESGIKDFPKLEPGKFYTFPCVNHERCTLGSGWKVWECVDGPTHHGEYKVSYLLLTIGPHDGVVSETFIYGWFGKGGNIVLELPEEQQAIYRTLKAAVQDPPSIHLPTDHKLKEYRNVQSKSGRSS